MTVSSKSLIWEKQSCGLFCSLLQNLNESNFESHHALQQFCCEAFLLITGLSIQKHQGVYDFFGHYMPFLFVF